MKLLGKLYHGKKLSHQIGGYKADNALGGQLRTVLSQIANQKRSNTFIKNSMNNIRNKYNSDKKEKTTSYQNARCLD